MSSEEGKTTLLVGAGFLGKYFIQNYLEDNPYDKIIALEKVQKAPFFEHPQMKPYKEDDRLIKVDGSAFDADTNIKKYFDDNMVSQVVYTAAIADVGYAQQNPKETYFTNVTTTGEFFTFLGNMNFKGRIVLMSSESVYKKKPIDISDEERPFKETDETGPHSVYGQTKLEQENIAKEMAKKYGLELAIVRSATMYGPYGRIAQVIPDYIRQLLENNGQLQIMGDGISTSRDFIYVQDTVKALMSILRAPKEKVVGQTFNIGTGRETFLLNLANAMKEIMGLPSEPFDKKTGAPRPGFKAIKKLPFREGEKGARIVLNVTKAKETLQMMDMRGVQTNWEAEMDLIYGLKATIMWVVEVLAHKTEGYGEQYINDWYRIIYPEKVRDRTDANPDGRIVR